MSSGRHPQLVLPAEYQRLGLLPLPPTYRLGDRRGRREADVFRYARRLMANLPHGAIHAQLPDLLREMADALERAQRLTENRSS